MPTETRAFETQLEIRQLEGQPATISGYAVIFNSWSRVMTDGRGRQFRERIAPTAFDRTLAGNPDIASLWNHNADLPLGRTSNGTLRITKDAAGLRVDIAPPNTSWGQDAVESIRRGDVAGMSFAFAAARDNGDTWAKPGPDGVAERTLLDVDLYELGPTVFPAYPATVVNVRSIDVPDFATELNDQAVVGNRQMATAQERRLLLALLENDW